MCTNPCLKANGNLLITFYGISDIFEDITNSVAYCYICLFISSIVTVENACKRCCRSSLNETCSPVDSADILADGTPCIQGFCNNVSMF